MIATLQERLAAQVIELQEARGTLDKLASSDALTNLCSRRRWFDVANSELHRYRRNERPFSVLMADLDYFKRVNDKYGHAVGDDVLKRFASLFGQCGRKSDLFGRVGGEEFAALLGNRSSRGTRARLPDHRELSRRHDGYRRRSVAITCSIGIAQVCRDDKRVEDILNRADAGLYEAKRQGRDRIGAVTAVASVFGSPSQAPQLLHHPLIDTDDLAFPRRMTWMSARYRKQTPHRARQYDADRHQPELLQGTAPARGATSSPALPGAACGRPVELRPDD